MTLVDEQYLTVGKAAELLHMSKSTLWRWINDGNLPAYRFGHRRVLIKQQDLDRLLTPARGESSMLERERERLSRPLTEAEKK